MAENYDEAHVRERLREERERVSGLIEQLHEGLGDSPESEETGELASYDQHPADQGTETFEREKDLSILERLEEEMVEIEAALQRVDDGTYGVDEVTGDQIDSERLDAVPTARRNVTPEDQPQEHDEIPR